MRRTNLQSSTLRSAGYNKDTQILELEFSSKEVYQYFEVPHSCYVGLMNASSHGSYFNTYIKDQYRFIRKSK